NAANNTNVSDSSSKGSKANSADSKTQPGSISGGRQSRARFFRPVTLAAIDLTTLGPSSPKIEKISDGFLRGMVVVRKTGNVYYMRSQLVDGKRLDKVFATNMTTHETREIGTLPFRGGSGLAVNADETLLGGSYVVGGDRETDTQNTQRTSEQRAAAPG